MRVSRSAPSIARRSPASLGGDSGPRTTKLDPLDNRLIRELRYDARTPVSVLARRLGVTRGTVRFRIDRLRRTGVVRKFTAVIDRGATRTNLVAFTLVRLASGVVDLNSTGRTIARVPGVVEVHDVAGSHDIIVKLRGTDLAKIGEQVRQMREVPGVASTETLTCVLTIKEED